MCVALETVELVERGANQARERLAELTQRSVGVARAGRAVLGSGAQASMRTGEQAAREQGADATAGKFREARSRSGMTDANELPIRHYEEMTAAEASRTLRTFDDPAAARAVLNDEKKHADRITVVQAAEGQLAEPARRAAAAG